MHPRTHLTISRECWEMSNWSFQIMSVSLHHQRWTETAFVGCKLIWIEEGDSDNEVLRECGHLIFGIKRRARLLNISGTRVKWCGQYLLFCLPHMLYFLTNSRLTIVGSGFFAYSTVIQVHCSLVNILIGRELSLVGSISLIIVENYFICSKNCRYT